MVHTKIATMYQPKVKIKSKKEVLDTIENVVDKTKMTSDVLNVLMEKNVKWMGQSQMIMNAKIGVGFAWFGFVGMRKFGVVGLFVGQEELLKEWFVVVLDQLMAMMERRTISNLGSHYLFFLLACLRLMTEEDFFHGDLNYLLFHQRLMMGFCTATYFQNNQDSLTVTEDTIKMDRNIQWEPEFLIHKRTEMEIQRCLINIFDLWNRYCLVPKNEFFSSQFTKEQFQRIVDRLIQTASAMEFIQPSFVVDTVHHATHEKVTWNRIFVALVLLEKIVSNTGSAREIPLCKEKYLLIVKSVVECGNYLLEKQPAMSIREKIIYVSLNILGRTLPTCAKKVDHSLINKMTAKLLSGLKNCKMHKIIRLQCDNIRRIQSEE